jgi:hypothetical protein
LALKRASADRAPLFADAADVPFTKREWYGSRMTRLKDIPAELLVMAGIGLILGLLGPFGTFALPLAIRVGAWLAMAIGGYACFRPVIAAGRSLSEQAHLPLVLAIALACIVAAIPVTVMIALLFGHGLDPASLAASYPSVVLVGVLATAIQFLLFARKPVGPDETLIPLAPPPPSIAATAPQRVHRSWWVARAAIAGPLRRERATLLQLSNGLEVPVARDSVALLRSRGWL